MKAKAILILNRLASLLAIVPRKLIMLFIERDLVAIAEHSSENRAMIAGLRRDLEAHGKAVQGHGRQIGKMKFTKRDNDVA